MQYTIEHHLIWIPKYPGNMIGWEITRHLKEMFTVIAGEYEFHIDTIEVTEDCIHIFIEAPPAYSPAQIIQILKSISAREIYQEFPEIKRVIWSGNIRSEGYCVRSVGDRVTADTIQRNIKKQ